jgi:hypothetical protein
LTLASAALVLSGLLITFGLFEAADLWIGDGMMVFGFAVAGGAWAAMILAIWSGTRRWRRGIRTLIAVLGVWLVLVPTCVLIGETTNSEFLAIGCALLGVAVTIGLVATAAYRGLGGRALADAAGIVRVSCPGCGYSMVGLDSCACPECGHRCTIDELIRAQDYTAIRQLTGPVVEDATVEPPPAEEPDQDDLILATPPPALPAQG